MTAPDLHIDKWLRAMENEHLEFKEAKNNFHFEKLVKYCAALANEGGGSIVLGITDKHPRQVVGTSAFQNIERTKAGLVEKLRLRITVDEVQHRDGRVLVFTAPARPLGMPVAVDGAYWMRAGEDLVPMTSDMLRGIFDEAGPDFSAEICSGASLSDLDPAAIAQFRERWIRTSGTTAIANRSVERLLSDAELLIDSGVTYAALILLGTHQALGRNLAQAEVVFEYRSSPQPGPANQREEFRQGFLQFYDKLWGLIDLRNDQQHFQHGFVMLPVPTFSENSVREAILNAVAHRDYSHPGSVFVRQYSRRVEIVSPGGFPPGITPENILDQQLPRNRRIAETFARCGLVERSGQGADRMLEECVRHGKPFPDFSRTEAHQVWLTLHGGIEDEDFLRFLERVGSERLASFDVHDFLALGLVARSKKIPFALQNRLSRLIELGVVERIARGKIVLSHRLYPSSGPRAAATRKRDAARDQNKMALVRHIIGHSDAGAAMDELLAEVPALSRSTVKRLLDELRREDAIHPVGTKRNVRWFPGPEPGFGSASRSEDPE